MRIGIDARPLISKKPSGIGVYLQNIISYIRNYNDNNEYYLYTNVEFEREYDLDERFIIRYIPGKIGTLWLRYTLPSIIKKDDIEIFWGTQHILPKKVKGIRYILTVHDLALLINYRWGSYVNAFMQNVFLRASVKDADTLIADSVSTANDLEKIGGVGSNRINVVYLGAPENKNTKDDNVLNQINNNLGVDTSYFLYIGTIEPRKNIISIVKAFENIADYNKQVKLVIAGGLGWKYRPILDAIKRSPHKKRILLTGYISNEEKVALYSNAKAFVFPSHYEGFGLPILEAYSLGCPVITSTNSSLKEVGGDYAFYVDNEDDYLEIARCMDRALKINAKDREQLKVKIKNFASTFTWDQCATSTYEILLSK